MSRSVNSEPAKTKGAAGAVAFWSDGTPEGVALRSNSGPHAELATSGADPLRTKVPVTARRLELSCKVAPRHRGPRRMLQLAQPFERTRRVLRGRFAAPQDEVQGWQAVPPIRNIQAVGHGRSGLLLVEVARAFLDLRLDCATRPSMDFLDPAPLMLAAIAAERRRASGSKLRETRGRGRIAAGAGADPANVMSAEI